MKSINLNELAENFCGKVVDLLEEKRESDIKHEEKLGRKVDKFKAISPKVRKAICEDVVGKIYDMISSKYNKEVKPEEKVELDVGDASDGNAYVDDLLRSAAIIESKMRKF